MAWLITIYLRLMATLSLSTTRAQLSGAARTATRRGPIIRGSALTSFYSSWTTTHQKKKKKKKTKKKQKKKKKKQKTKTQHKHKKKKQKTKKQTKHHNTPPTHHTT